MRSISFRPVKYSTERAGTAPSVWGWVAGKRAARRWTSAIPRTSNVPAAAGAASTTTAQAPVRGGSDARGDLLASVDGRAAARQPASGVRSALRRPRLGSGAGGRERVRREGTPRVGPRARAGPHRADRGGGDLGARPGRPDACAGGP